MQALQDKIKVVIVDDEPQSIHRLQDDLATLEDFEVIATSSSAVSAKNLVMSILPDDVFSCTFDEATHLWQLKLSNGQVYKLKRQATAKTILSLSPSLAQVRQDCIINLDYLLCIENYTLRCIFSPPFDQEEITVSRRCYKAVKDQLEIL